MRRFGILMILVVILQAGMTNEATAQWKLKVLGWNIESGGNKASKIAEQLEDRAAGYDIVALTEVKRKNFGLYRKAVERGGNSNYRYIASRTGGNDSMLIIYDVKRLALNSAQDLFNVDGTWLNNKDWSFRSPLVAKFYDRHSRKVFLLTVNHLARTNAFLRESQATGLRRWAESEKLPIIGVGDLNFDYRIDTRKGNSGYDALFRDGTVEWVIPENQIDTNWSDRNGDNKDDYPNTILDFAFVANQAKAWSPKSRIIKHSNDFPDTQDTSDHRAVEIVLTVP